MKIVSWQYLLSDHQVFTWREMQKRGHMVQFVLGKTKDDNRSQQGWSESNLESLTTNPLPLQGWWKTGQEIILKNQDAIHIFSGFWADKRFIFLILFALGKGIKTMLMNESYTEVQTGYLKKENGFKSAIKVQMRPLFYKTAILMCKLASKNNPIRVLSISQLAEKQFSKAGVQKNNIFPWGYFIPKNEFIKGNVTKSKSLNLIYLGNLLPIKGLDLAINAIEEINQLGVEPIIKLDVYGYGDPSEWIPSTSSGICHKGVIPFGHTQEVLAKYDYLILPSRYDGWGVVVNEALLQGVPVILSDKVGAKTLIDNKGGGVIFKSEDKEDLIRILNRLITEPNKQKEYAKQAALIAPKLLPSEAAIYLEEILDYTFQKTGQRPIPNWER